MYFFYQWNPQQTQSIQPNHRQPCNDADSLESDDFDCTGDLNDWDEEDYENYDD